MLRILTICAFLAVSSALHITYKDCGSTGTIKYIDLSPCTKQPCQFKQGTNASVSLDFVSKTAAQKLTTVVFGEIAGVDVPFPFPNPNACTTGVKCPIKAGDENIYKNTLQVLPSYPVIRLAVKWELKDENGNAIVCALFPLEIVHG